MILFVVMWHLFQSTLPLRGATRVLSFLSSALSISIHAPLTGSDDDLAKVTLLIVNFNPRSPYGERHPRARGPTSDIDFNPRSPYGERPGALACSDAGLVFQSTLPLRGATFSARSLLDEWRISIHAPLTGSDQNSSGCQSLRFLFQSTLPLRGAT